MKHLSYIIIVIALCSVWLYSCGKKDTPTPTPTTGTAILVVHPQHHNIERNLTQGTVYIKYNTLDYPTGGIFDDSAKCVKGDTTLVATFNNLKNGNYYLFGNCYDPSVSQTVVGGAALTITKQDTTLITTLAVSEQ